VEIEQRGKRRGKTGGRGKEKLPKARIHLRGERIRVAKTSPPSLPRRSPRQISSYFFLYFPLDKKEEKYKISAHGAPIIGGENRRGTGPTIVKGNLYRKT
jgi:hypothetical protein